MKTSELTGAALDWTVAKCEGLNPYIDSRSAQFCRMMYMKDWEGCDDDLALIYPSMKDRVRYGEMRNNIPKYSKAGRLLSVSVYQCVPRRTPARRDSTTTMDGTQSASVEARPNHLIP